MENRADWPWHHLDVEIAADRMTARARWKPGMTRPDPLPPNAVELMEQFLSVKGVVHGIRKEGVAELLHAGDEWVVVAKGTPPGKGEPGRLEWLISRKEQAGDGGTGADQSDAIRIDLRERGGIESVSAGTPIVRLIPPVPGEDGIAVTGERVPAPLPPPAKLHLGRNAVWSEDGSTVVARTAGHPVYDARRKRLDVSPVYRIKGDVDYAVGHVRFEGSIHIGGTVKAGFRVSATGDVVVEGAVDGGLVDGGADVKVGGGIYGGTQGEVKAAGSVSVKFIQQGRVSAGLDLVVSRSILQSRVVAGRDIIVQSPSGVIAGSTCTATRWVKTAVLGSAMATPTTVQVGLPQSTRDRWRHLQERLRELEIRKSKLALALQIAERRIRQDAGPLGMPAVNGRVKDQVLAQLTAVDEELDLVRREMDALSQDVENFREAAVWVAGQVYPGVKITIGNLTYVVHDEMKRIKFFVDGGEIRTAPIP